MHAAGVNAIENMKMGKIKNMVRDATLLHLRVKSTIMNIISSLRGS